MNPANRRGLERGVSLCALAAALALSCASARASEAPPGSGAWELSGSGWRHGRHEGTAPSARGLTLAAGAAVGTWSLALPAGLAPFDRALASLNPAGAWPEGAEVALRVRLEVEGAWTAWLPLGRYGRGVRLPRSESGPPSRGAAVKVDVIACARAATRAEVRLELRRSPSGAAPGLRRLVLDLWRRRAAPPEPARSPHPAWGSALEVPRRSQGLANPRIASRACSPTSLGMVLAFHGRACTTEEVAAGVEDHGADILGNWAFNVAYAGERGCDATARHLFGWRAIEDEIAAGRPVVLSHRYPVGQLENGAIAGTVGHLIVVVGFTPEGDVVVNDPAGNPTRGRAVRRVYRRDQLWRSWQQHAEGVVYLVRPRR